MPEPPSTSIDTLLAGGAAGVVAILRGVRPEEVVRLGEALLEARIRLIEVPLNSPRALDSVAALADAIGTRALIGAGTVLTVAEADAVADAGGRLLVSPHCDPQIIRRGIERGLTVMPGFLSPSEAFAAITAGARDLKLFPARTVGAQHVAALKEVLPADVRVWAVGGVGADNLAEWLANGAAGVGVGGALYRPGITPEQIALRARQLVAAWNAARQTGAGR
jgi:2-dehydro-3-deoxyphosphogalactonate aldolase